MTTELEALRAEKARLEAQVAVLKKEGADMMAALERAKLRAEHAHGNYMLALDALAQFRGAKSAPSAPVMHA